MRRTRCAVVLLPLVIYLHGEYDDDTFPETAVVAGDPNCYGPRAKRARAATRAHDVYVSPPAEVGPPSRPSTSGLFPTYTRI